MRDEIMLLRITVPLSMFCLDCSDLNEDLANRAKALREKIVQHCIQDNRDTNRGFQCFPMLSIYRYTISYCICKAVVLFLAFVSAMTSCRIK